MSNILIPRKNNKAGFTLVEMLVSVSIFVLVAFTVTATLIAVSDANRKAQELKQIMDNLNFSIQSMVLRMREGSDYTCANYSNSLTPDRVEVGGKSCPNGDNAIIFNDPTVQAGGVKVAYYFIDDAVRGGIVKTEGAGGANIVTAPEVDIDGLVFRVGGVDDSGTANPARPRVFINIFGTATLRSGEKTPFNLQTMVSQHKP